MLDAKSNEVKCLMLNNAEQNKSWLYSIGDHVFRLSGNYACSSFLHYLDQLILELCSFSFCFLERLFYSSNFLFEIWA